MAQQAAQVVHYNRTVGGLIHGPSCPRAKECLSAEAQMLRGVRPAPYMVAHHHRYVGV